MLNMRDKILSITSELQEVSPEYFAGETPAGVSECVPNQAVSAKEAYQRALRGVPVYGMSKSIDEMEFDGEQKHGARGEYLGETVDFEGYQPPIMSDELDAIDHLAEMRETVLPRLRRKPKNPEPASPTPPAAPQDPAPAPSLAAPSATPAT